jgi:hypothetical protein
MGVLAIAAVSLHRRLFPYLRILDVRRDADRRPSILERAEPEMDR